jgi:flavodoxin
MKKIVAFYSKDGNCKALASALSKKYNCKLLEIEEASPRKNNLLGFLRCGREAFFNQKSKLKTNVYEKFSLFTDIILVSPVWASKTVPAINTVLSNADFTNKKVTLFACQADPNFTALKKIKPRFKKMLHKKGGEYESCYCVQGAGPGKSPFSEERFNNFVSVLLKN